jgi:crotonobetaine/carnitine-CoA ligase
MKVPDCPVYAHPDYPMTYGELIDWAVARTEKPEEKILFRMLDTKLTYSEFQENVNRISNFLREMGVRKGDHVAIFLSNCVEYAYLYHSLGKCGAVMIPINPFVRGEPLQYILKHSEAKYLITSNELFAEKIARIIQVLDDLKAIVFVDDKEHLKGLDSIQFRDYVKCSCEFEPDVEVSGDDVQGIWYTSGTTGTPKGAVINHKTYIYRVLYFAKYFRLTPDDVICYILPMYHVGYAVWGGPLAVAAGAQVVQVHWFSATNFWKDIVRYGCTITFSTGTVIPILLKQPISEEERIGREQLKVWVGWPVDEPDRVRTRWPKIKFLEAYGTTEAPVAAISDIDNPEFGNAGPPTAYTNLRIVDPKTGKDLPPGEVGEIVYGHKLGADYILKEYYKEPEKTREAIQQGYWYSGDLGLFDEKGRLKFVDRLKDYLRVGGENVSSSVVEAVIRKYEGVMEVAVVGMRGELGHDEIVAHVVPKEGVSIDPKAFFDFCNDNMAYFMVPRYLVVRRELPKTSTMRIEKYRLREEGLPPSAFDRNALGIKLRR